MKKHFFSFAFLFVCSCLSLLAGCSSPDYTDKNGVWHLPQNVLQLQMNAPIDYDNTWPLEFKRVLIFGEDPDEAFYLKVNRTESEMNAIGDPVDLMAIAFGTGEIRKVTHFTIYNGWSRMHILPNNQLLYAHAYLKRDPSERTFPGDKIREIEADLNTGEAIQITPPDGVFTRDILERPDNEVYRLLREPAPGGPALHGLSQWAIMHRIGVGQYRRVFQTSPQDYPGFTATALAWDDDTFFVVLNGTQEANYTQQQLLLIDNDFVPIGLFPLLPPDGQQRRSPQVGNALAVGGNYLLYGCNPYGGENYLQSELYRLVRDENGAITGAQPLQLTDAEGYTIHPAKLLSQQPIAGRYLLVEAVRGTDDAPEKCTLAPNIEVFDIKTDRHFTMRMPEFELLGQEFPILLHANAEGDVLITTYGYLTYPEQLPWYYIPAEKLLEQIEYAQKATKRFSD